MPYSSTINGIRGGGESQLRLVTSVRLRWTAVFGQLATIAVVHAYYGFPLQLGACLAIIAASAWVNVFLSIRFPSRYRLSNTAATALLCYDILQLALLLWFTGGISNPFAFLLVAPVTVAAATLPPRHTMALAALVVVCAGLLFKDYHPLPWYHGLRFELPWDYRAGILIALISSMIFLAFFTWRLSREAREMSAALAATDMVLASEQRLHALDGLAAAAAHELGTPLSTIVLVAKELENEFSKGSSQHEDVLLIRSQATRCREILQKLTRQPGERDPMHETIAVEELLEEAAERHRAAGKRLIIASGPLAGTPDADREPPNGHRRPGVIYGLGNIIENAIGFANSEVHLSANWNGQDVLVTIADDGPGFKPELMDSLGEPYVTSRRYEDKGDKAHSGLGLGFFIAKTLLERSGAVLTFSNAPPPRTGAIVQVRWPRQTFEMNPTEFEWPGRRRQS